jgi:hypothetical protein
VNAAGLKLQPVGLGEFVSGFFGGCLSGLTQLRAFDSDTSAISDACTP